MTLKKKRTILRIVSFVIRVLPLLIVFILKANEWVTPEKKTSYVSLGFGAVLCLCLIFLAVIDKMPKPNGLMFPTVIFMIILSFDRVLPDLKLLFGMYLIGAYASFIVDLFVKDLTTKINREDQADATTSKIKSVLGEMLGGERNGESG